jgi:exodeoxyribonuclease-5
MSEGLVVDLSPTEYRDLAIPVLAPALTLSGGQQQAMEEITAAMHRHFQSKNGLGIGWGAAPANEHSLQGYAGTGKTTLMQFVVKAMREQEKRVVLCAPTNKAVAVLERKMREAGISVPTMTIYSLLGLTPGNEDAKRKPKRVGKNKATRFDVVVIDECSMLGIDIMDWVKRDLAAHFVLYIGDPAQLPPVGETLSQSFLPASRSMLMQIMRQAEGNPIIALATDIREMIKSGVPEWSRFHEADDGGPTGIYCPGDAAMQWIEDAFTSKDFSADNDRYRYLCWTNARVAFVNSHIRKLIYGETETPFIADERVLVRSNITDLNTEEVVINTNDEAVVEHIKAGVFTQGFDAHAAGKYKDGRPYDALPARQVDLDVWEVTLRTRAEELVETRIARDATQYKAICDLLIQEAGRNRSRWYEYFSFTDKVSRLQSVYAMTVHCSQGSTFENVFVDMNDCARNSRTIEMLQLLYVACTRPSRALVLV